MPPAAPKKGKKKASEDDLMADFKKGKALLKPDDQLDLNENELKEVENRCLLGVDPVRPESLVIYDYQESAFVPIQPSGNYVEVYETYGVLLHRESEAARIQYIELGLDPNDLLKGMEDEGEVEAEWEEPDVGEEHFEDVYDQEPDEPEPAGDEEEKKDTKKKEKKQGGRKRKLMNQFNFSDRAALTYNNPTRSQYVQVTPPSLLKYSGLITLSLVTDALEADYQRRMLEEEIKKEGPKIITNKEQKRLDELKVANMKKRMADAWKILERMVNQNTFDEISKDYRYWDDPADEFREDEGMLLPLWKFSFEKTRRLTVTDITWNPHYYDLFAVAYGFLDFTKPVNEGYLLLYSLKNPSYPDYIRVTESAVMCVDTHYRVPYMVVVGLYDGMVLVYNLQLTKTDPIYKSNSVKNKHRGQVWDVKWAPDMPDGEMNFYSIGTDGKVNHWILMLSDLQITTITILYLKRPEVIGPDGTKFRVKGCASCFQFHPTKPLEYLVGTEEGKIYKCSTYYTAAVMLTYNAHHLPVYRIAYNKYNDSIFASCSADWRIKVWEDERMEPLYVFDVGFLVGDIEWAPYSSTVFAAAATSGICYIYDLNMNKYKPVCSQPVVSKKTTKLTRLSFNRKMPIIALGDDKGNVNIVKLSPNLRKAVKPTKKQQGMDQYTLQMMKLDALLALAREPLTLARPPDIPLPKIEAQPT